MSPRLAAALPLPPPPAAAAATAAARRFGVPRPLTLLSAATSPACRHGAMACLVRLLCSHHSSSAAAAAEAEAVEEARRGRKQLGMTPPLYDYLLANVREHPVLRELREETAAMRGSQQVSPSQAQLLAMLVQVLGAQRCIEVGVFTGDVAVRLAKGNRHSGAVVDSDGAVPSGSSLEADRWEVEEAADLVLELELVGPVPPRGDRAVCASDTVLP